MATSLMSIEVYMDYVLINGQRVTRPGRITRSVWVRYWERLVTPE